MIPWKTIATAPCDDGLLELRQRGDSDFMIVVGGRVLMISATKISEQAVASLAVSALGAKPSVNILIGGLGMAYTLRAALDTMTTERRKGMVTVCELNRTVVDWCHGPLAALTDNAVADKRVKMIVGDVAAHIANAKPGQYDAIILDLYEGPYQFTQKREDPFFGPTALARTHAALAKDGVFAVWSEDHDGGFVKRLEACNFAPRYHKLGQGGRQHVVYIAKRVEPMLVRGPRKDGAVDQVNANRPAPRRVKPRRERGAIAGVTPMPRARRARKAS